MFDVRKEHIALHITIFVKYGEIWRKRSNLTSLLLIVVFAEVGKVSIKVLNIKSYQPLAKTLLRKCWSKMFFHIVTSAFYLLWQKMLKFEGCFNNKKLWEMTRDRSGYVAGGAFILVAVNKYVVNKCHCSACYSSRKCYLRHEVMREYYFKKLIDACCFWILY